MTACVSSTWSIIICVVWCSHALCAGGEQASRADSGHLKTARPPEIPSKQHSSCMADVPLRQLSPSPQQLLPRSPS